MTGLFVAWAVPGRSWVQWHVAHLWHDVARFLKQFIRPPPAVPVPNLAFIEVCASVSNAGQNEFSLRLHQGLQFPEPAAQMQLVTRFYRSLTRFSGRLRFTGEGMFSRSRQILLVLADQARFRCVFAEPGQ